MDILTVDSALTTYLDYVMQTRSKHTVRTYGNAINAFRAALVKNGLNPSDTAIERLGEDSINWLVNCLNDHSPATERLYVHVMAGFYEYIVAERLADINLPRLRLLIRQRERRPGIRPPQFPAQDIGRVLEFIAEPTFILGLEHIERLRALRDRAFLFTLADTGLRVHEACNLRRGDVDWNE